MIEVIINDFSYDVPTKWDEVTLEQWVALVKAGDAITHVDLLAIFTGLDKDVLANLPCDAVKLDLIPEMDLLSDHLDLAKLVRPAVIRLGGKELAPVPDPGRERYGQKVYLHQTITEAVARGAEMWELIAPTIACYYAPALHPEGKWDDRHVKQVEALVYSMKITEAYPEAAFFLSGSIVPRKTRPGS